MSGDIIFVLIYHRHKLLDLGSISITTGYELDGLEFGVRIAVKERFFSSTSSSSGAHPVSYPVGTGDSLLGSITAGV
jgi:hypothetical protein